MHVPKRRVTRGVRSIGSRLRLYQLAHATFHLVSTTVHTLDARTPTIAISWCSTPAQLFTHQILLVALARAVAAAGRWRSILVLRHGHFDQPLDIVRVMSDFEREVFGILERRVELGQWGRGVGRDVLRVSEMSVA